MLELLSVDLKAYSHYIIISLGGGPPRLQGYQRPQAQHRHGHGGQDSVGKDGKMLTKAALTMPRDLGTTQHLNQGFRLGFMQVTGTKS